MRGISKRLLAVILVSVMILSATSISVSAAGSAPLYAPAKVSIQNSGTGFYITWSKAAGAVKYRVYYKTKESGWYYKDAKTNTVNLSNLLYGKLYYVQVQSIGSNNAKGGCTKVASMTHVRTTKLVSAAYNSDETATVSWNIADGANGYAVARKKLTDIDYTYFYTTQTTFTDTKFDLGVKYFYQVRPYYSNGKSAAYAQWSNTISLTTIQKPTITDISSTDEKMSISWDTSSGATSYKVAFRRDTDAAWSFGTTDLRCYDVPNPAPGATYYVQVCPINGNLAGPYSAVYRHETENIAPSEEPEPTTEESTEENTEPSETVDPSETVEPVETVEPSETPTENPTDAPTEPPEEAPTEHPTEATTETTAPPEPTTLQLNTSSLTLGVNEQYVLKIKSDVDIQNLCTFSSGNKSIATVDYLGRIYPQKPGTVTITCSYKNLSAKCTVTIYPQATKLTLNATNIALGVGEQIDLNSFINSGTAAYYRVYSTSNSAVASVTSSGGLVTAKAAGSATITCKLNNGLRAACSVKVYPYAKSLTLNATSITLEVGKTFDFNSFVPAGYAARYRDFYSQNTSIVSITKSGGLATGLKIGTTKIYCQIKNGVKAYATVTVKKPFRSVMLKHLQAQVGNSNASYVKYLNSKSSYNVSTSFAWCAEFAWCTLDQFATKVNMKNPVKPCIHVSEIAMQAKSKGALKSAYSSGYVPKPGDLFTTSYQKYPGSDGRLHIGFIESVETNSKGQVTKIHTIEGNYNWETKSSTGTRVSRGTWVPDKMNAYSALLCEYIDIEKLYSY